MANNSKWYVAGVLLIGAVIGIVFVGILTSVVHWAGSPKFCGTPWISPTPPTKRASTT